MTLRLAITGANGFVGQAVSRQLAQGCRDCEVRLFDQAFAGPQDFACFAGDLCDPQVQDALAGFADCVIHLAALPGGAAAAQPALSRRINVDVPLDLIERLAGKRLIYASSVAVLGSAFSGIVDDDTPPRPDSTYGTHKQMAELGFADGVRRGAIAGLAIRLPGVVARPAGTSAGFGSAFLSEVFHAARAGAAYVLPVAPDATSWLISAQACAANLVDAAFSEETLAQAVTMPALTVEMADLLGHLDGLFDASGITHAEDPAIRRLFGSYPHLVADRAIRLGMRADADIAALVRNVFADG